jgi:hypothetical protein
MKINYSKNVEGFSSLVDDLIRFIFEKNQIFENESESLEISFEYSGEKSALAPTGAYNHDTKEITIFVDGRHIKDILRSLAHELIHFVQGIQGKFPENVKIVDKQYAQKDPELRKIEEEAYRTGNILFRDWEDARKYEEKETPKMIKENKTLPTVIEKNEEVHRLLMESIAKKTKNSTLLEQLEVEKPFPKKGTRIQKIRWIVAEHQMKDIEGTPIDVQTANLLLSIWNRLEKEENRAKFERMPIILLVNFANKAGR